LGTPRFLAKIASLVILEINLFYGQSASTTFGCEQFKLPA
jgi:hypothetical protein